MALKIIFRYKLQSSRKICFNYNIVEYLSTKYFYHAVYDYYTICLHSEFLFVCTTSLETIIQLDLFHLLYKIISFAVIVDRFISKELNEM